MAMEYPLADIKVLDLSRVLAGPFVGRMLCDLGADVVQVEPPDQDVTRLWGRKVGSNSGYYNQQNAGKRNISIDLRTPHGISLLGELVREADILIENFRPGVMNRLGIGWENLSAINPRLIMLSISGFGQDGPESQRAAYAPIVHAETGSIHRQAEKAGGHPVEMCMSFADTNAGLHGLVAALSALHLRQRTGTGQHIDIAMVDAMLACDDHAHYHLEDAEVNNGASEVWNATGGPIILAGDFRHIWKQLVTIHGMQDPTPEGAPLSEKIRLRREAVGEYLLKFPSREDLVSALDAANLAWGNVNSTADFLRESPTLRHRNSIVEVDDRQGGRRPLVQSPYRYSDAKSGIRGGAPFQGEHNEEVLSNWLGMTTDRIEALTRDNVLIQPEEQAG
ncbi:MAG: CoA transferase [Pseudomonadales bacterium]|nr:CoA transferase [Pseudomonadales bacterium]